MKYSTVLFGVLASASIVAAGSSHPSGSVAPPKSSVAPPKSSAAPEPEDDCDGYPMSSVAPPKHSSVKVAPVPVSSVHKSSVTPKPHPSSSYKAVYPYPVETICVTVVVPEYTVHCTGPTTIINEHTTFHWEENHTTDVCFSNGPYTRTKTHLECGTTTTEYYSEEPCPSGWPYESGEGYTPIPVSYTPVAVAPAYAAPTPGYVAPAPGYVAPVPAYPSSAPSSGPLTSPIKFTSGASHLQAGVIALFAGVVAAVMVL